MKKIMLIGYGAMAQAVIERLPPQVAIGWIVAREPHHAAIHAQFGTTVEALTSPQECLDAPDFSLCLRPNTLSVPRGAFLLKLR